MFQLRVGLFSISIVFVSIMKLQEMGEDLVADGFCVTHKKTSGSLEICVVVVNCMWIVFLLFFLIL